MNKLIVGLILVALGVWGASSWWWFLWDVIKGLVVVGLFGIGVLLIGLGALSVTKSAPAKAKASQEAE